jgi:protein tyrosine phosphatase (PTP) superfamily phosphohydrolase (DUF442 family)
MLKLVGMPGAAAVSLLILGFAGQQAAKGPEPIALPGTENPFRLSPRLYSGGDPHGEAAFAALRDLGVRTIISVDGAAPDVEAARREGLKYVHLPIGYDGVPEHTRVAMAKVLTELDGPVYVHCHHGKHRGPAALVAGAVCTGAIDTQRALEFMALTGVSKNYDGLWSDVGSTVPMDAATLYVTDVDLPARADVGGYAGAMSLISRANDRLKLVIDNGWEIPADHPDLAPSSDLGLIHNLLRSLRDDAESLSYGARHAEILEQSIAASEAAETAYTRGDLAAAAGAFKDLGASCKACHVVYRD